MSWNFPTTVDTPTFLALMPDWGIPVTQETSYRTTISRSRSGLEQRAQRMKKPVLSMQYSVSLHDAQARRRIEAALATARGPLIVPWWPNGSSLREDMTVATLAGLTNRPIAEDWAVGEWVFIWSRETGGGEWRELAGVTDANATLVDTGGHTLFPLGSYVFPGRKATREADPGLLTIHKHEEATETLRFRTIF